MTATAFINRIALAIVGLAFLASSALAQQPADDALTVNLTVSGEVDDTQVYLLRYAVLVGDDHRPEPREQIQFCGGVAFPGATSTLSDEPCRSEETYTVELEVEPGTPIAIMVMAMRFSDPENGFRVLMQTFEGERPSSPEHFTELQPGTTHWIWVNEVNEATSE